MAGPTNVTNHYNYDISYKTVRRVSAVSTSTRYGQEGAGIGSGREQDFPHSSIPASWQVKWGT